MNVQSTVAASVNQTPATDANSDKGRRLLTAFGATTGLFLGSVACASAYNRADRKVFENKLLQPFLIKSEFAPVLGSLTGYFVGEGVYQALTAWAKESGAIKVCACIGGVYSMLAGRELMYSLVDISSPFPDSVPCTTAVGVGNEIINDYTLLAVGAGTGYMAGKGIEYVARKARAGIDMATRGVASLVAKARPDVMVEPDGGKKSA